MDELLKIAGFNTRVVALFYDKDEYAEEIKILGLTAQHMANRPNLRIGIVTDQRLVTRLKKSHAELFLDAGMSVMILRRYDGTIFKANLADTQPARYVWWITVHSMKPVEKAASAAFQLVELARIPIVFIYVDLSKPAVAEKSRDLIKLMETIAPEFKEKFMFFWTDESHYLDQRRSLGITWDELPAIGSNNVDHKPFAYPRKEPFKRENLDKWLRQLSLKKTEETELRSTDFAKRIRDPTMYENFLERSIVATREVFDNQILTEDVDSIVFIYSTENVNYVQRKQCFQFNLVIETLSNEAIYGDMVGDKLKFYSYDAY